MKRVVPFELARLNIDILNMPFRHRKELAGRFRDVLGLLCLDYLSIEIANPVEELIFFSSLPCVNLNLVINHLWPYDGAMSPTFYKKKSFFTWETAYQAVIFPELKSMKETAYGFHYSFTMVRKINHFHLLYSFATKNKEQDMPNYFSEHKDELLKIGDYCYKLIPLNL